MEKVDQHLIESMKKLSIQEPESYVEDYAFLTYDYAFMVAEQGNYELAAEMIKESIDAFLRIKNVFPDAEMDLEQLHDIALGFHDLMIEMVESGYYDMAEEMRTWIRKMLDSYGIKLKNK